MDVDNQIYPGATELCDGKDNGCNGSVPADELDPDNDGVMECEGDCAPNDENIFPGNTEICDGIDNNCDGEMLEDELDADGDGFLGCKNDCAPDNKFIYPGAEEICDGIDNDCSASPWLMKWISMVTASWIAKGIVTTTIPIFIRAIRKSATTIWITTAIPGWTKWIRIANPLG